MTHWTSGRLQSGEIVTARSWTTSWLIVQCLALAFISLICTGCRAERWVDQALLHDNRSIEVSRTVAFHFGSGELSNALSRWPDQYSLMAKHPDTEKTIRWFGERHFNPILLDFWEGIPYLVIVATNIYANLKQYGCPEIPYVFFRLDQSSDRWTQITSKEFPPGLRRANLSFSYDGTYMRAGKRQSKDDIESRNELREHTTNGSFTRIIPTDFATWKYPAKNQYRLAHYRDGCRHTCHPKALCVHSRRGSIELFPICRVSYGSIR